MAGIKLLLSIAYLSACACFVSSCNSLFYHPHQDQFATPAYFQLDFSEHDIQTSDQVNLKAWWIKPEVPNPETMQAESNSLILQFHGNAENMTTHFASVAWLAKAGYHVMTFDYRGYGQSDPVPPSRRGLVDDGLSVLKWISRHPTLQTKKIIVIGQSLGGAVCIPVIAEFMRDSDNEKSSQIRGVVLDSTFSSYRRVTQKKLNDFWLTWPIQYPLSFLVTDELSPQDYIHMINVPILMMHAENDPVVPYATGKELFYKIEGQDAQFWNISVGGHTAAFYDANNPYREKFKDWLKFITL